MNNSPAISVILPVFNSEKYIQEAVLSILSQTFTDFELIIIDDASTDQTPEILKTFDDKRIILIRNQTNLGLPTSLNKAIELARGKYIARMDADDISLPNRFETQVKFLENHHNISIVGSFAKSFGGGKPIKMTHPTQPEEIKVNLLFKTSVLHPTIMMRRDFLQNNKLQYNPNFLQTQDYEFFVRASIFGKIANIPKVLLLYRKHQKQATVEKSSNQMDYAKKIIEAQFLKLGIVATQEELQTAVFLKKYAFINDRNFPSSIEKLFLKIIKANDLSKNYNDKTLKKVFGNLWLEMAVAYKMHEKDVWHEFWTSPIKGYLSLNFINIYRILKVYSFHLLSFGK